MGVSTINKIKVIVVWYHLVVSDISESLDKVLGVLKVEKK